MAKRKMTWDPSKTLNPSRKGHGHPAIILALMGDYWQTSINFRLHEVTKEKFGVTVMQITHRGVYEEVLCLALDKLL